MSERFQIIPAGDGPDLFVVWDRLEEEVIDVLTAAEVAAYNLGDSLWDRPPTSGEG